MLPGVVLLRLDFPLWQWMHTRKRVRAAASYPPGFDSAVLGEFEGNDIPLNNRATRAEHPVF